MKIYLCKQVKKVGLSLMKIKNILYLGWLGQGNVGDDVLFELFKILFYKNSNLHQKNIAVNIDTFHQDRRYQMSLSSYDLIVLGAGSLMHLPYWINICKEAMSLDIPVVSWGSGIDGEYKNDQDLTEKVENMKQYHSFYENIDYLSVRGPLTKKILKRIGVKNNIHEVGDPALHYAAETYGDIMNSSNNKKQILINWGTSYNNIFGRNEEKVENELVKVIHHLLAQGYNVKIYPIWTGDILAVQKLTAKVADKRCEAQTVVYDAKGTQKVIQNSFLTINMKLHANILSASANKPFISLAYRGKCFDFSHTVQCLDYTVATDQLTASNIIQLVAIINNNYDDIIDNFIRAKKMYYPRLLYSIKYIANLLH